MRRKKFVDEIDECLLFLNSDKHLKYEVITDGVNPHACYLKVMRDDIEIYATNWMLKTTMRYFLIAMRAERKISNNIL